MAKNPGDIEYGDVPFAGTKSPGDMEYEDVPFISEAGAPPVEKHDTKSKVAGLWKQNLKVYVKVLGAWIQCKVHVKNAGAWIEIDSGA